MKGTIHDVQKNPPAGKISFEEFLAWADEDVRAEWVNGEIIIMSPASDRHQALVGFLYWILQFFIEKHDLGWLRIAPFQMRLPNIPSSREPDLLFVRKKNMRRVKPTYLNGPADMVVEITSPESIGRDRGEKFVEYEKGKVFEYWLIDLERKRAEFYRLGVDGRYYLVALDADGRFHSEAIKGFWLRPEWLWRKPLPKIQDVAKELKIM